MRRGRKSPGVGKSGFSLIEVTISLGVAAVILVTILGMLPPAMRLSRDSADQTAIGTVLETLHNRLEGLPLEDGIPEISPAFFDQRGRQLDLITPAEGKESGESGQQREWGDDVFFRADLRISGIHPSVRPSDLDSLKAVAVELSWPVDEKGDPMGASNPKTTVTWYLTTLTGTDWKEVDPAYRPKIEF